MDSRPHLRDRALGRYRRLRSRRFRRQQLGRGTKVHSM